MIVNNRAMSCQQRAMTRKPRIEYPRALLNVIVRGNNRQEIFHDDGYRRAYRERLGLYLAEGRVTSILLTVESRRQETAGYAPGPGENTLEGRGLVPAVSGGAVLGVGGLHRAFKEKCQSPWKVAEHDPVRELYCHVLLPCAPRLVHAKQNNELLSPGA
jgi:hypothetical protein